MRQLDVTITVDQLEAKRRLEEVDASIASLTAQFKAGGLTTTQYADKLRELNTATTAATKETKTYGSSQDKLGQTKAKTVAATDQLTLALRRYLTYAAVLGAIKSTLDYAASLEKMKAATDISYKGLQQLQNIGASTNTTVEAMTLGIQDLQKRLALGEDSAVGAIKKLGINLQAFMELSPDEQFYAIARALKDHNEKAGLASQLFRNWKEIMPALTSDVDGLKDSVRLLGNESIQSGANIESWFNRAWLSVKRLGVEAISAKHWLDRIDPGMLLHGWGGGLPTPPGAPDLSGALPSPLLLGMPSEAEMNRLAQAAENHLSDLVKGEEDVALAAIKAAATLDAEYQGIFTWLRSINNEYGVWLMNAEATERAMAHIGGMIPGMTSTPLPLFSIPGGQGLGMQGLPPGAAQFDTVTAATRGWVVALDDAAFALSRVDAQWARTAERMIFDIKDITKLWKEGDRAGAVGAGLIMAGNMVPTDTTAGSIASGALAGAGAGAAIGAPYAAATLGLSVAVGAGVGALVGWYQSGKAAKQINDARDAFLSQNGELGKLHQHLVKTLGPMGDLLTQQLLAAKNSHEWAIATQAIEDALAAYTQKVETAKVEILSLGASFNAIVAGSTRSAESVGDLGTIAIATYAAMTEAGYSHEQAIAASHDGLKLLREAYATLGLTVEDTALQMLLVADAINTNNPALVAGVGALASQFEILSKYGLLNVDTFDAMQRTGADMYTRLQDEVSRFGGTTRDALVPMQQYLHSAEDAAKALGIPLDANTQMLIDQSKELGVWKDKGKDANQLLLEGIDRLVQRMDDLINRLHNIPNPSFTITGNYIPPPNLPTEPGDGTDFPGYHSGGVVMPFIPRAHRGLALDEVPIIAQAGEGILSRGAMRRLGRGGFDRMNAGGGLGTTVVIQPGAVVVHSVIESPQERHRLAAALSDDIQRELDLRAQRSA